MRLRLANFWEGLRASFWFIPSLMVAGAFLLSAATLLLDQRVQASADPALRYLWRGGPEGARELLQVIASSMITVASLTFSLTLVAFSQASAQFGPRLLRNFMRDTGNQVVLGTFIATFVYSLLTLRAVHSEAPGMTVFVPFLAVSTAFILALASLGVLIYFIHHVSQSIYAPNVIASVADDLMGALQRLFPQEEDPHEGSAPPETVPEPPAEAARLTTRHSGYVQGIDYGRLTALAAAHDVQLTVTHRPGQFVIRGGDLARVWPPERAEAGLLAELRRAFVVGAQRVAPQDVEFAIDQLVEVAVRALSPAINDPFTAMNCIDWLGVGLARLAEKRIPPPYFRDAAGARRVFLQHPITFAGATDAAFNQIRQQVGSQVAVRLRLLEVLAVIAAHTEDPAEWGALRRQADMIRRSSQAVLTEEEDLRDMEARYHAVIRRVMGDLNT
jgi:uncharacterized membrane protein